MSTLKVDKVTWAPRRRAPLLLHETSFELEQKQVLGIVGPNGAGKTTLLRLIYGYHSPLSGSIHIDGENLSSMPPRATARVVAAVLQEQPTDFALNVREIVALGRIPHRTELSTPGHRDHEIVKASLARMDLAGMQHRSLSTLSGGERQRVMMARALAQEPRILVLDEPTNHLDIRHQLELLQLIRDLDLTIVTSLHDLNLAADICDRILVLKNGRSQGFGEPRHALQDALVSTTFQIRAQREQLSLSQKPHLSYELNV